jgi:hypothetical protein
MAHLRGAFKVNSARVVRAVKETGQPDQACCARQKSKRSKFVQEI